MTITLPLLLRAVSRAIRRIAFRHALQSIAFTFQDVPGWPFPLVRVGGKLSWPFEASSRMIIPWLSFWVLPPRAAPAPGQRDATVPQKIRKVSFRGSDAGPVRSASGEALNQLVLLGARLSG